MRNLEKKLLVQVKLCVKVKKSMENKCGQETFGYMPTFISKRKSYTNSLLCVYKTKQKQNS